MSLLSLSNEELRTLCKSMRISPLAERFIQLSATPDFLGDRISGRELVSELVMALKDARESHRIRRELTALGLWGGNFTLETMNFKERSGMSRPQAAELLSCGFIRSRRPLVLTGETGTGKAWICSMLCTAAVLKRFRCSFGTVADTLALMDGLTAVSVIEQCRRMASLDLVVLLKLGETALNEERAANLAQLLNTLLGRCAVIIASQIDLNDWKEKLFGSRIELNSALDTLRADALVFRLTGGSLRPLYAPERCKNGKNEKIFSISEGSEMVSNPDSNAGYSETEKTEKMKSFQGDEKNEKRKNFSTGAPAQASAGEVIHD